MKRISQFLGLKKSQAELDFVDIEVGSDTPLFLDPAAFHEGKGGFARECAADIEEFFDAVLDAAGDKNWGMGMELLRGLQEPDEIQFGFSDGKPRGRGIGQEQASQIFRAILKSKAIQSGMIQDLNDAFMFIPGIGPDKVSDITANIIRKHLIAYTQNQFALYGVDIPNKYPTGLMWDSLNRCWYEDHDYIPFYKGQKVLLVPKWYVKYHYDFTKLGRRYYDGFVASFIRDRELSTMGKLVSFIPRKNSPPTPHVYKHDIEKEVPRNKDSIVDFTHKHPEVYRKFRDAMLKHNPMSINALVNAQGDNFREMEFSTSSIDALNNIPTGNRSANDYQSLIVGIIHFILYPSLTNPVLERPINDGRKRIDISFDNSADRGIFYRLRTDPFLLAREVMIECKNYTDDLENPEIDQLIGRFDNRRGRFGILVCRSILDKKKAEARCTDAFKAQQGVVVILTDSDICEALAAGPLGRETRINEIIEGQLRSLLA